MAQGTEAEMNQLTEETHTQVITQERQSQEETTGTENNNGHFDGKHEQ